MTRSVSEATPLPAAGAGVSGRRTWLGLGLVVLATLAWSTAGLFITNTVRGSAIAPLGLAFWRVFCTFLIMLVALACVRPRWLRVARRDLPWLAGMGALAMGSFQVLWIASILANGVSLSTIIQCNAPILVTILARIIWREALTWRKWAAIGLALAGTVLLAYPRGSKVSITLVGLLIALGCALTYAGITLFAKRLTGQYNAWTTLVYAFGFAALALLPFQFREPLPTTITPQAWAAFGGLLLISTIVGYTLYTTGLKYLQASVGAITAQTEVPFAAFWGYVLLGERLDGWQILGAVAVMGGVILLSLRANGEQAHDRESRGIRRTDAVN